jgi:hypothetical protein
MGALDATHRHIHTSRAPNPSESPFRLQVRRASGGAIYSITKRQGQPKARSQSPAVLVALAITLDQPPHAGCCPSISASVPPWQRIQPARRGTSSSSPKGTRSQTLSCTNYRLQFGAVYHVEKKPEKEREQLLRLRAGTPQWLNGRLLPASEAFCGGGIDMPCE